MNLEKKSPWKKKPKMRKRKNKIKIKLDRGKILSSFYSITEKINYQKRSHLFYYHFLLLVFLLDLLILLLYTDYL